MAGVPRASLVVIAATLGQFNIPEAGMLLLLASTTSSTWRAPHQRHRQRHRRRRR
jgi:hypothetical protein